jgi:hypothetical protein
MSELITDVEQLTPERLTELLRTHGALPHGRVMEVQRETAATGQAQIAHLTLTYSPDAPVAAPCRPLLCGSVCPRRCRLQLGPVLV